MSKAGFGPAYSAVSFSIGRFARLQKEYGWQNGIHLAWQLCMIAEGSGLSADVLKKMRDFVEQEKTNFSKMNGDCPLEGTGPEALYDVRSFLPKFGKKSRKKKAR